MAIYGVNFNGTQIPDGVRRKFRRELKLPGMRRGEYALLVGVAQSDDERDEMLVQGTNGTRRLHVEPRQTVAGVWYGIYVHYCESIPTADHKAALARITARLNTR